MSHSQFGVFETPNLELGTCACARAVEHRQTPAPGVHFPEPGHLGLLQLGNLAREINAGDPLPPLAPGP
jgi:hypothetical protein